MNGIPCIAITASNDPMLAVSVDASIFYKPDLDGIDTAIGRLFWPETVRPLIGAGCGQPSCAQPSWSDRRVAEP